MHRNPLQPILVRGVLATLVLPVVIASTLGLRALLESLGDADGAVLCGRAGLVAGVLWLAALAGTVAATAVAVISAPPPRRPRHRRPRFRPPPPGDMPKP